MAAIALSLALLVAYADGLRLRMNDNTMQSPGDRWVGLRKPVLLESKWHAPGNPEDLELSKPQVQLDQQEQFAIFVSSRGLLKSMDIKPHRLRSDAKMLRAGDYIPVMKPAIGASEAPAQATQSAASIAAADSRPDLYRDDANSDGDAAADAAEADQEAEMDKLRDDAADRMQPKGRFTRDSADCPPVPGHPHIKCRKTAASLLETDMEAQDMDHYVSVLSQKAEPAAARLKTVYVVTTALKRFRNDVLPAIQQDIVLVTGDSDIPPEDVLGENMTKVIDHPRIKAWFAQNTVYDHEKMNQMPIGLDYHTLSISNMSWGTQATPLTQEKTLLDVRNQAPEFQMRQDVAFTDKFRISHRSRQTVWDRLKMNSKEDIFIFENKVARTTMWKEMSKHKFIVSPRGRGYDCHRTWESIALGSVPLVSKQAHTKLLKDNGLPFIEMEDEDWANLHSDKMKAAYESFKGKDLEIPEAMKLEYWVAKIHRAAFI